MLLSDCVTMLLVLELLLSGVVLSLLLFVRVATDAASPSFPVSSSPLSSPEEEDDDDDDWRCDVMNSSIGLKLATVTSLASDSPLKSKQCTSG